MNLFILLFLFFGCIGSSLLRGLSLGVAAGATLSCSAWASHCGGFSCCRARALGTQASVVVTHGLSCSAACGIFPDQARTRVPCIGRQIPNHCATREALSLNSSLTQGLVSSVLFNFSTIWGFSRYLIVIDF